MVALASSAYSEPIPRIEEISCESNPFDEIIVRKSMDDRNYSRQDPKSWHRVRFGNNLNYKKDYLKYLDSLIKIERKKLENNFFGENFFYAFKHGEHNSYKNVRIEGGRNWEEGNKRIKDRIELLKEYKTELHEDIVAAEKIRNRKGLFGRLKGFFIN